MARSARRPEWSIVALRRIGTVWSILRNVKTSRLFPISFVFLVMTGLVSAQQNDPSNKPSVTLEHREKPPKESDSRTIQGIVEDAADNPVADAIVQLKDTRTRQVVDYATKADGKFVFRDLYMDVNYELLAKRGGVITPVKKVSIYDSRKEVVVNFHLEPPEKQQ
jgi:Carboxypeptidase regulatory-like domain